MTKPSQNKQSLQQLLKPKTVLDVLLLFVVAAALLIFGAFVFTYAVCAGQEVGCGDIILLALPLFMILFIVTPAYLFMSIYTLIVNLIKHKPFNLKHFIATIILIPLSFIPSVGPLWYITQMFHLY